ncbi:ABC transporter permease subunit [Propylenella binzhouense]|uniref:Branched-chain amino acid ABC transporter permease n=1 Tax=Propylenella binzhouense TaxID=2555902 RepID=A0A964T707_9HYPH|nr:branched-chain amino acid ABC transporter permease [Propylenella binzhouense]
MTVDLFLLQLFTGLALGSIFVLVALGLSLIFGLLTIVNFAHGQFFMLGAYVGAFVLGMTGNFWLSLIAVPLAVGAVGMLCERFLVRPLYGRGIDYPLLLTYGLGLILLETVRILAGTQGIPFNTPPVLSGAADLGFFFFPKYRLFLIAITAIILVALWLFLERTSYGLIIRAGARDQEIVQVLGVDVGRVWLVVFGVGVAIAGLAGVLAAPIRGVFPEMGVPVLVEAFVVTVVGGMGSLLGAVVAGLAVGVTVSFTSFFYPEMATLSMFLLMALVLVFRPRGLFGRAGLLG